MSLCKRVKIDIKLFGIITAGYLTITIGEG